MSLRGRVYIASLLIVLAGLWGHSFLQFTPATAPWETWAVLLVLTTVAQLLQVRAPNHTTYYVAPAFVFAGALLLPPLLLLLLIAIPKLIEWANERLSGSSHLRAWYLQPFNIAKESLSIFAAVAIWRLLDQEHVLFYTPASVFAGIAAAGVYVLISELIVSIVLMLARGASWRDSGMLDYENLLVELMVSLLGYTIAVVWSLNPWLIVPVLSPLALVYRAMQVPQLEHEAEMSKLKSAFLATMSHEIRTPMNGVLGMTNLLLQTSLNGEQRRYVRIVSESAHSLLHILTDVLDFSKIEAGKLDLDTVDFEPRTLVENTVELMLGKAREQRTLLLTYVDPQVPLLLRGDPGRLRQVLLNLVSNAVKFTKAGEVEVRITAIETSATSARLRFAVIDTGIGISPDAARCLFQPFNQADSSTTRKYGGTGLGLAISKRLVEAMGGEIGVESVEGQGSTFWCSVPFPLAAPKAETPAMADELRGLKALAALRHSRVLVVDQSRASQEILESYLTSWGLKVDIAASLRLAQLAARAASRRQEPYAVVFIERTLLEANPLAALADLREQAGVGGARIVLLENWDASEAAALANSARCADYLLKPVKQLSLMTAVTGIALEVEGTPPTMQRPVHESNQLILLAEDNPINVEVALLNLRHLGYHADVVVNGRAAVDAVATGKYALVLMDCHMPEVDGYMATAQIRASEEGRSRLPVIALTAGVMRSDREACFAAGMDDYLSKPLETDELRAALQRWLPPSRSHAVHESQPIMLAPVREELEPVLDPRRMTSLRKMCEVGDSGFLDQLIDGYLRQTPEMLAACQAALIARDGEALRQAAHRYKGASANLGAVKLVQLCAELEAAGRSSEFGTAVSQIRLIETEAARVGQALSLEHCADVQYADQSS
ncbi:MAG: hypothetical protein CYG59_06335 [Chloroflexi bacterium]|nr:MAG: hypothetical protein CYG59_06335 [Chloroflexota bacterium]